MAAHRYRDVYYPGTEELDPNEMRIIALGTGMPMLRPSQASASWFVELGNGDKFFFDLGTGSIMRFAALHTSYHAAHKVFFSHIHSDHSGDFGAIYIGGLIEGRRQPLRIWGPSGATPEMGTKHFIEKQIESYVWDITSRTGRAPVEGFEYEVNEVDFAAENEVIYDENGVVVRGWPAIHAIEGPVSFSLEWNGLKFVYGGDTSPNRWYAEYAKNADVAIHECFITVDLLQKKLGFPRHVAINVGTVVHTSPAAFGKVMSEIKPRMAIAYHFFNDTGTAASVFSEIRTTYDGPLSLARDLSVWNVTADEITLRETVANLNTWPPEPGGPIPPDQLTYDEVTQNAEWIEAGRLTWPDVDQFD